MLSAIMDVLDVLIPLFVAVVTAFGAVIVAKLNRVHEDMQTNHGSKNIGNAVDIIRTKVDIIGKNQEDLVSTVTYLHRRDEMFGDRLKSLEDLAERAADVIGRAEKAVTDSIRIPTEQDKTKEK